MVENIRIRRDAISEQEIQEMASELLPVLDKFKKFIRNHKLSTSTVSLWAWFDGSVSFGGDGLNGWDIIYEPNGDVRVRYRYEQTVKGNDD